MIACGFDGEGPTQQSNNLVLAELWNGKFGGGAYLVLGGGCGEFGRVYAWTSYREH